MTHQNKLNQFNPIQKIIIENFQSHQNTQIIPAGPGQLTVIVGQSRQGKTAIFRALRWLFYNAPDGADFIRWGATFARVTAEYADGTQVIRYRTAGGVNRYIIRKPGEQEQVYEGFGRGAVPLEVQQVTGVSPVEIGEGLTLNLNLAEQLDGPFLGNKAVSSTSRAKVLGKLAGTEEVDLAGKQLGTDLFRWKREQEAHEKAIKETEEQLRGYDYLPGFKANLDRLVGIRDAVKAAMERRDRLDAIHDELNHIDFAIFSHEAKIKSLDRTIIAVDIWLSSVEQDISRLRIIQPLKTAIDQNAASIFAVELTIRKTQGLSQAEKLIRATEGQFERRQQTETIIARWNKVIWGLEQAEEVIRKTQRISQAETLVKAREMDIARKNAINILYTFFVQNKLATDQVYFVLDKTKNVNKVESSLADLYASMDRKNRLAVLMDKWNRSKEDMAVVERQMKRTAGIGEAEKIVNMIDNDKARIKWLDYLSWNLDTFDKQIKKESMMAKNAEEEVERLQEDYFKVLKRAGRCPMCNSEVDQEKVKEIL